MLTSQGLPPVSREIYGSCLHTSRELYTARVVLRVHQSPEHQNTNRCTGAQTSSSYASRDMTRPDHRVLGGLLTYLKF